MKTFDLHRIRYRQIKRTSHYYRKLYRESPRISELSLLVGFSEEHIFEALEYGKNNMNV